MCLYLPFLSLFFPPGLEWCFPPLHASISSFSENIFFLFFFLFALYINEIGFFCSPMEDNHSSNCHLIAKFHRTVKGRNTGERALKKYNGFYLYICVSASDLLASSHPLPVISCSFSILCTLSGGCSKKFFSPQLIVSNRNIKIKVVSFFKFCSNVLNFWCFFSSSLWSHLWLCYKSGDGVITRHGGVLQCCLSLLQLHGRILRNLTRSSEWVHMNLQ